MFRVIEKDLRKLAKGILAYAVDDHRLMLGIARAIPSYPQLSPAIPSYPQLSPAITSYHQLSPAITSTAQHISITTLSISIYPCHPLNRRCAITPSPSWGIHHLPDEAAGVKFRYCRRHRRQVGCRQTPILILIHDNDLRELARDIGIAGVE